MTPVYVSLETIARYSFSMIAVALVVGYTLGCIVTYKVLKDRRKKK